MTLMKRARSRTTSSSSARKGEKTSASMINLINKLYNDLLYNPLIAYHPWSPMRDILPPTRRERNKMGNIQEEEYQRRLIVGLFCEDKQAKMLGNYAGTH